MTKATHKYEDKLLTGEPFTTEITMNVKDIKTITNEDLEEKPKEEYDKLLLKVYWYLKGIDRNTLTKDEGSTQLLEEIEDFI